MSSFELTLGERTPDVTLTRWLLNELRRAILDGRLKPGVRLPSTREFANQYGVSRGTVVSVFQQLQADGYLHSQIGGGTWVSEQFAMRRGSGVGDGGVAAPALPISSNTMRATPASPAPRPFSICEPPVSDF